MEQGISTPPPLIVRGTKPRAEDFATGPYTREGVIAQTNLLRDANGHLPPLAETPTLNKIAALRLEDMFKNQYFAHVSPAGASAFTVAKRLGYDYLALGENLALGDFEGDRGVVDAWMHSPGHRANILNAHYTEIGVAVSQGMLLGEDAWIAVQIFGRPAAGCPLPDANLKTTLDAAQAELSRMQMRLKERQSEMNSMPPADYNAAVEAYNALVAQYDELAARTKSETERYNAEVSTYNKCIEE